MVAHEVTIFLISRIFISVLCINGKSIRLKHLTFILLHLFFVWKK